MDHNQYESPYFGNKEPSVPSSDSNHNFAAASLILGLLAILATFMGIGMIPGALAIILAILSKGRQKRETLAKVGIITGSIAIAASIVFTVIALKAYASGEYDELIKEMEETYQSYLDDMESPMQSSDAGEKEDMQTYLEMDFSEMI